MATQDDILNVLNAISADADELVSDFAALQDALATAQASSGANLQPVLDAANAVRSKLDALAAKAAPAPAPAPASGAPASATDPTQQPGA